MHGGRWLTHPEMVNHPGTNLAQCRVAVTMLIKTNALPLIGTITASSSFLACNSRLRSAIRRHHPPQRAVLSQICCFGESKVVLFQILLDGAEPRDAGTT